MIRAWDLASVGLAIPWLLVPVACATPAGFSPADVTFDTATVWLRQGADSASARVEVAATRAQHEVGLADRTSLASESGMLFLFDPPRSADEGFWMWRTRVALDIAFVDAAGAVLSVQAMEPCTAAVQEDCPGYFADAPYAAALEMSSGWFERHAVGPGARLRVER